jgi:hypothetical protein
MINSSAGCHMLARKKIFIFQFIHKPVCNEVNEDSQNTPTTTAQSIEPEPEPEPEQD